jgi:hypothetical protein
MVCQEDHASICTEIHPEVGQRSQSFTDTRQVLGGYVLDVEQDQSSRLGFKKKMAELHPDKSFEKRCTISPTSNTSCATVLQARTFLCFLYTQVLLLLV